MSPESQRVAIAEACGWTCIEKRPSILPEKEYWLSGMNPDPVKYEKVMDFGSDEWREPTERDYGWESIPDYFTDLNACHEMEMTLKSERLRLEYWLSLSQNAASAEVGYWTIVTATAPQRCESFLRTLGLWKEDA